MDATEVRDRRIRDANYTPFEKKLIVKLVHRKKDIVLSTKTDAITGRKKEKGWIEIASIVNATLGTQRTWQSVKGCWENLKRRYRREHAESLGTAPNPDLVDAMAGDPEYLNSPSIPSIFPSDEEELEAFCDADEKPVQLDFISVPDTSPNGDDITATKKPYVMFLDNTKSIEDIQIQDVQSSVGSMNCDISLFEAGDNNSSDASNTVNKRTLKSFGTRLLLAKKPRVTFKDVAVCTEECSEERRRDELHLLSLKEKEIRIQILEVELMRKRMQLKKDFPDQYDKDS